MTEKPFACKAENCGMTFTNEDHLSVHERKHELLLSLHLEGQKSGNIFVGDQTPTPTCLIKNCEEVGLFEDLRHVNPFDETFRRAVEQSSSIQTDGANTQASMLECQREEDSLHTPQVFPLLEGNAALQTKSCAIVETDTSLNTPSVVEILTGNTTNVAEISSVSLENSNTTTIIVDRPTKYRNIAEKITTSSDEKPSTVPTSRILMPASIQFVQPQVITLNFAPSSNNCPSGSGANRGATNVGATMIPVQTVRPFIMPKAVAPKVLEHNKKSVCVSTTSPTSHPLINHCSIVQEPSSASLTPTSQLPIKERLKVILGNSSKTRRLELSPTVNARHSKAASSKSLARAEDDFMERRRAASTRYRTKMRRTHEELRRKNIELQSENAKLKERIRQLEAQPQQKCATRQSSGRENAPPWNALVSGVPAQIQVPSTLHLVMNIQVENPNPNS